MEGKTLIWAVGTIACAVVLAIMVCHCLMCTNAHDDGMISGDLLALSLRISPRFNLYIDPAVGSPLVNMGGSKVAQG